MTNDSISAEDRCSGKLPVNESKSTDSVDFNSNALVEPNRESAADIGEDDGVTASSAVNRSASGVKPAVAVSAASNDTELSSVAHMLDAASADNFRTLLLPSLTPPKTVTRTSDTTAVSTGATTTEDVQSAAEAVARDIIHQNKVHLVT